MSERTIDLDGRTINAERLEKVLFPDDQITKGDLIDYYQRMARVALPYLRDRPLTMQRFPDGIAAQGFYQKETPDYFPDWIRRVSIRVEEDGEDQDQIVCDNAATLVYLANQAVITPHIWLSRADKLDHPDKMIFDFDPADDDFGTIRWAAKAMQTFLEEVGLQSFVMTTGSRGLHVVVPLDRSQDFSTVREFARDCAKILARRHPERLTIAHRKEQRKDRLFLDYLRNAYAQNSVAPYAVRALPGAPVATPLDWKELDDSSLHSRKYTIGNISRRLGQKEDPWRNMMAHTQSLTQPSRRLGKLASD